MRRNLSKKSGQFLYRVLVVVPRAALGEVSRDEQDLAVVWLERLGDCILGMSGGVDVAGEVEDGDNQCNEHD